MDYNNQPQNLTKKERRELKRQEKGEEQIRAGQRRVLKRVILWSFIILGIGGVVFGMIKITDNFSPDQTSLLAGTVFDSDWVRGNKNSPIILVEYSDFQCPACVTYLPFLKQLNKEFENKVQFVYRHFPLKQIHPNAEIAAVAAEAAGKQDKFWEMHDMIFEKQNEWSRLSKSEVRDKFTQYAQELNIDIEKFKSDLDSEEIKEKINNDYDSGVKFDVQGTPTFFLNGNKIQNPQSYEEFRDIINKVIEQG